MDVDFHTWAAALHGEEAARAAAHLLGVVTFDADPGPAVGRLRLGPAAPVHRARAPAVRWPVGGWPSVVDRLAARARELGVRIETSSRVDVLPEPPVIVATQLESARALLGDDGLAWESGRCVLLDVGLVARPGDAFLVVDLDDAGFVERATGVDTTLAPAGHALVQADMPLKPGEPRDVALARLEHLLDLGFPRWRERVVWRRPGSRRAGPALSTCPAPPGATGPRSTAAAGSSWPATWWPHPASARRSPSTARCTRRGWPQPPFGMRRPGIEERTTFIEREHRASTMRIGVRRSRIGIRPGCLGATMSQPTPDPTRWLTELMSTEHVMWPGLDVADTTKAMAAAAAPWTKAVADITALQLEALKTARRAVDGPAARRHARGRADQGPAVRGEAWTKDPRYEAVARTYLAQTDLMRKALDAAPIDERQQGAVGVRAAARSSTR